MSDWMLMILLFEVVLGVTLVYTLALTRRLGQRLLEALELFEVEVNHRRTQDHLLRDELELLWEELPDREGDEPARAEPAGAGPERAADFFRRMGGRESALLGEDIVPPAWHLRGPDGAEVSAQTEFRDRRDLVPREGAPRSP